MSRGDKKMKLATPDMISKIDNYAHEVLGIPKRELMRRSAEAVLDAINRKYTSAKNIVILAGKGNNGGDGYAIAALSEGRSVTVCDVFSAGQRTDEGAFWLEKAKERSAEIVQGASDGLYEKIASSDLIVDAIFGTGFVGEPPVELLPLIDAVNSSSAVKVAVDVPLGANALDGSVCEVNIPADITVTLSYPKPGLLSYPARNTVGELVHSDIGLPREEIEKAFEFNHYSLDMETVKEIFPNRKINGNKGSFGKTTLIVGSEKYRGAAHLAVEAALRSGAGIVRLVATEELCREIRLKFPEVIYFSAQISEGDKILDFCRDSSSVLIGCGSSISRELFLLTDLLLENYEGRMVLDADALNSVSEFSSPEILKKAKNKVLITPHPLELSRLSGASVAEIEAARLSFAKSFAEKYSCALLLKGASTVITDGVTSYINDIATTALSKGGSGDVLSGAVASLLAFSPSPVKVAALAAFVHATAGKNLEAELSSLGVIPSDLPKEMAKILCTIEKST